MSLDVPLARITRHVPRFRGWHRLVEPLRRHYVKIYQGRPDRWVVIDDFEGDMRLRVDRSAYISSVIYWRGVHSYAEASLIRRHLPHDGVFLDVGANQGELTLIAARRARRGRVFAFEPIPSMFELLHQNVHANGLSHVTPVPLALSNVESDVEMFTSDDSGEQGSINEGLSSFHRSARRPVSAGRVHAVPLDLFVERQGLDRIDLIKIDVEGAEREVLEGARATLERFRPSLILEWNEPAVVADTTGSLQRTLRSQGYALYAVDPFGNSASIGEGSPVTSPTVFARHESRV